MAEIEREELRLTLANFESGGTLDDLRLQLDKWLVEFQHCTNLEIEASYITLRGTRLETDEELEIRKKFAIEYEQVKAAREREELKRLHKKYGQPGGDKLITSLYIFKDGERTVFRVDEHGAFWLYESDCEKWGSEEKAAELKKWLLGSYQRWPGSSESMQVTMQGVPERDYQWGQGGRIFLGYGNGQFFGLNKVMQPADVYRSFCDWAEAAYDSLGDYR